MEDKEFKLYIPSNVKTRLEFLRVLELRNLLYR